MAADDRRTTEVDRGVRGRVSLREEPRQLLSEDVPSSFQATPPQDVSLRNECEEGLHGRKVGTNLVSVSLPSH